MPTKLCRTIIVIALCAGSVTTAQADVNVGGWVAFEYDGGTNVGGFDLRTNTLVTYDTPELSFGVGLSNVWFLDPATHAVIDGSGDFYALLRIRNVTLSFGEIYGAGNLFPEDYFGFRDTTSISDQVTRIDIQFGDHNFALSNDLNGGSLSEIEIGYSGIIANHEVAFGYEADNEKIGLLVGRDFGMWGFQVAAIQDIFRLPGSWNHAGLTVFHDFNDALTVAGNVAFGTDSTTGLHSYGVLVTYAIGNARIKAEYFKDVVNSSVDIEVGVVIPFGTPQPSANARFALKEYRPRFLR